MCHNLPWIHEYLWRIQPVGQGWKSRQHDEVENTSPGLWIWRWIALWRRSFAPFRDWSISYGIHPARELLYNMPSFDERYYTFNVEPTMSGTEASRKWMMERKRWTEQENLASGAEFAIELWLSHLCSPKAPECEPPREAVDWEGHGFLPGEDQEWCRTVGVYKCMEYKENDNSPAMSNCGQFSCCRRKVSSVPSGASETCCVLFNDLLLNYTVTSDLSQCSGLATTMTTTLPLKTCPPKPVTLEEARTLGRAQISPYEPDGPQIQETLQWSRDRVIEAGEGLPTTKITSVSLVRNVGVCILSSVWCSPLFLRDMCVFFWCSITKLVHFFATTQHCSKISFEFLFGTISYKKRQQTNVVQEHGPVGPYDRYTWSYNPP